MLVVERKIKKRGKENEQQKKGGKRVMVSTILTWDK